MWPPSPGVLGSARPGYGARRSAGRDERPGASEGSERAPSQERGAWWQASVELSRRARPQRGPRVPGSTQPSAEGAPRERLRCRTPCVRDRETRRRSGTLCQRHGARVVCSVERLSLTFGFLLCWHGWVPSRAGVGGNRAIRGQAC